ncbi:24013_t:CDS:2 [Entrophospora sp. SA101]|nr:13396_t:CDS:2 [Entrophospora sp. SA101]CAJ0747250.1 24013_t:CDS:2 [Entrophospora sp. SA101]
MLRERAKQKQNELTILNSVTGNDSSVELETEKIENADNVEISDGHINFWADLEKQSTQVVKTNEEYEAEKKAKEKKSERQFTMYLDEVKEKTPWYVKLGFEEKDLVKEDKKSIKSVKKAKSGMKKAIDDPLITIKSNLDKLSKKKPKGQARIKTKSASKNNNNEASDIEKLREKRLEREKREKLRAQRLLNPDMIEEDDKTPNKPNKRYYSQYNPNETKTAHDHWVKRSRNEQYNVESTRTTNNNNKRQGF